MRDLDRLIQAVREDGPAFDRSNGRGFDRVAASHERRVSRGRVVRRALGAASAVAVVVVVLLRAGSSSADAHADEPNVVAAAAHDGDGGDYAHD